MSEKVYHFGFGVNADYVKYAGILMTNLTELHPERRLCFHFACDGIEAGDQKRLAAFARRYRNVKIKIYDAAQRLDQLNPIRSDAPERLHRATLIRIILPELLPPQLERLVYMDVDMVCRQRLDELFTLKLEGCAVAAAEYPNECRAPALLGLTQERYFNAGLLVLDLQRWRSEGLTERVLEFYQRVGNKLPLLDQDALNAVIDGNFLTLDKRYNFLVEANNLLMAVYPADTAVLHCINESKQWMAGCLPEISGLYWRYVRQSPWHELRPSEPATVKAAFLAATTAEVNGEAEQAIKYYLLVIDRFFEHYQSKNPDLLQAAREECLRAEAAKKQGDLALAARCYGLAASRLSKQYLLDNPEIMDRKK